MYVNPFSFSLLTIFFWCMSTPDQRPPFVKCFLSYFHATVPLKYNHSSKFTYADLGMVLKERFHCTSQESVTMTDSDLQRWKPVPIFAHTHAHTHQKKIQHFIVNQGKVCCSCGTQYFDDDDDDDDCFYIALFSTLKQTHCAHMWFYMSD